MKSALCSFVSVFIILLSFSSCGNPGYSNENPETQSDTNNEQLTVMTEKTPIVATEETNSKTERIDDSTTSLANTLNIKTTSQSVEYSTSISQLNKDKPLSAYIGMKTSDLVAEFGNNYQISGLITFDNCFIEYEDYQFWFTYNNYNYNQLEEYLEKNDYKYPPLTGNEAVTGVRYSGNEVKTIAGDLTTDITLGELRERFDIIEEGFPYALGGEYRVDISYNGYEIAFCFESETPKSSDKAIVWSV